MKIKDIIRIVQEHASPSIQESYDNSGLITGDLEASVSDLLICLDVTEAVVNEAITLGAQMIISHHPLVFKGLKQITQRNTTSRILIKAIQNNLNVYAAHTNLDKVMPGVSSALADRLELKNQRILVPDSSNLLKLITFIPEQDVARVSNAIFEEGAGRIGAYDSCSFQHPGTGTFRGQDGANPYVGEKGQLHREAEIRFEAVVPRHLKSKIVKSLLRSHPYEEVAFDLVPLENSNPYQGLGIIGDLEHEMNEIDFMRFVRDKLDLPTFKHTAQTGNRVQTVALCGGSGSAFLPHAIQANAQAYISADFKYHQFFDADDQILILDIGHYESEVYAIELLKQIVTKKLPNFAVHLSEINTNPIKYF